MGMGARSCARVQRSDRSWGIDHRDRNAASTVPTSATPSCEEGPAVPMNARAAARACEHGVVKVILRNPRREIELTGPKTVINLLAELDLNREAHLVMRDGELIPGDAALTDDDVIEVRPVISGGDA